MAKQATFRRIVLGLSYHRPNHGMRMAAEFADLLQLELFGLFVEEENLLGLAALPFAREFKLFGGGWRSVGMEEISHDLEIAARSAERAFTDAAKALRTECQFEVVRGSMAETIASISRASDIIVLTEADSLAECATPKSLAVVAAALHSAAAVLLVPARVARHSGSIVAIATEPEDPSIEVAKAVAVAAKEELVIVEAFRSAGTNPASITDPSTKIPVRRIPLTGPGMANESGIWSALGRVRERLVVMTRSEKYPLWSIASMRQVPILIVEPPRHKGASGNNVQSAA